MKYLDFDLKIEPSEEEGVFRASVLRSPGGERDGEFRVPYEPMRLENFRLKLLPTGRGVRRIQSPEVAAVRHFGGALFKALFGPALLPCLRSSMEVARREADTGLRLKLRLQDAPELATLPWEFLRDPDLDRFLALSDQTPLVRYVEVPEGIAALPTKLPLRVLVVAPKPPDMDPLDTRAEIDQLERALAPLRGRVEIEVLPKATMSQLQSRLRRGDYHVFHFIGHGGFDERGEEGVLCFEDDRSASREVTASELGVMLHDERTLRLAVLNACEGARNSPTDPFAGVATTLVRAGVPAVVAMQSEITDGAAIAFAAALYDSIAGGRPVDAAMSDARKAVHVLPNEIEWATPVLYMRAEDGVIFEFKDAAPPAAPGGETLVALRRHWGKGLVALTVAALIAVVAKVFVGGPCGHLAENPWIRVSDLPIEMQRYEVSGAAVACWQSGRIGRDPPPESTLAEQARLPARGITWNDANAYCSGLQARLPTVAEWRIALTGAALPPPCATPGPIARAAADRSKWNIHDLLSNVDEWSSDGSGDGRWYRLGASCDGSSQEARSEFIESPALTGPAELIRDTGFRCVRDTPR